MVQVHGEESNRRLQIELVPDLSHCIETIAKREYAEIVNKLLSAEDDEELQQRAVLLQAFLETTDFRPLRRESESHLIEGKKVTFIVCLDEGLPEHKMEIT